ncbi:MAG: hypothetical protein DHS20C09_11450 [marine bacterium B5-7]|nr:MAG: hypothetical protein DHS20C09_11450 [marine bacterium B5-7]
MFSIESCDIPDDALLGKYRKDGSYTDCYVTDISITVTYSQYIAAFYTTLIFKLERLILKLAVSRPSTDAQVAQLATGSLDEFAAWYVEDRCENQLLLCDYSGRTRSWLMVVPLTHDSDVRTRLYFGSAVVPVVEPKTGKRSLVFFYRALLGFHKLYSVVLLYAARSRLG